MINEIGTISECDSALGSIRTVQCDESKEFREPDISTIEFPSRAEMTPLKEMSIFSPDPSYRDKHAKSKFEQYKKVHNRRDNDPSFSDFLAAFQCADSVDSSRTSARARTGQTSMTERQYLRLEDLLSRGSLPVHSLYPCTLYCGVCEKLVHTVIGYSEQTVVAEQLLKVLALLFSCCGLPPWLSRFMVHKCPECENIIGDNLRLP